MATSNDRGMMPNEDRVVQRLRECGASSFEDLTRLPGLDWVTVFSIVDRLNRAGFVVLERHGTDYRVSLEKGT
jgi:DNA-binding MarR family transcriptional regulator